jgi:hypothetical protein
MKDALKQMRGTLECSPADVPHAGTRLPAARTRPLDPPARVPAILAGVPEARSIVLGMRSGLLAARSGVLETRSGLLFDEAAFFLPQQTLSKH